MWWPKYSLLFSANTKPILILLRIFKWRGQYYSLQRLQTLCINRQDNAFIMNSRSSIESAIDQRMKNENEFFLLNARWNQWNEDAQKWKEITTIQKCKVAKDRPPGLWTIKAAQWSNFKQLGLMVWLIQNFQLIPMFKGSGNAFMKVCHHVTCHCNTINKGFSP